jgi:hypothetical protein
VKWVGFKCQSLRCSSSFFLLGASTKVGFEEETSRQSHSTGTDFTLWLQHEHIWWWHSFPSKWQCHWRGWQDRHMLQRQDWQSWLSAPVVHKFIGGAQQVQTKWGTHINKESFPPSIFRLFLFLEIMQLLVEETKRYYHQHLETVHEGCSTLPDVSIMEKYLFFTIIVHYGSWPKRQTERLLVHTRTVIWGLLQRNTKMRHCFLYWDFCIIVTTEMNLIRLMQIMTGYGK